MPACVGGVGLIELFEQPAHLFRGYANTAVRDHDANACPCLVLTMYVDMDRNQPAISELDRVADKIQQDLANAFRVPPIRFPGTSRATTQSKGQSLGLRLPVVNSATTWLAS